MNKSKVIGQLKKKYPGKNIIALPPNEPAEILCEVDPSSNHPDYSVAVSVIDKSAPHYHQKATEFYKILKGELDLYIDGVMHHLKKGESIAIKPPSHHYASGNETWIECRSRPGWTNKDHLLVKDKYTPLI